MNLHELLIEARKVQAERGLAQGIALDEQGRVCPQGAVQIVLSICPKSRWALVQESRAETIDAIREVANAFGFEGPYQMYQWSDSHMLGDVLERFDAAIEATAVTVPA